MIRDSLGGKLDASALPKEPPCGTACRPASRPGLSWWPLSNRCMTRLQAQFNRNGSNYFEKAEGDQHEKKGRLGVRTQHLRCAHHGTRVRHTLAPYPVPWQPTPHLTSSPT